MQKTNHKPLCSANHFHGNNYLSQSELTPLLRWWRTQREARDMLKTAARWWTILLFSRKQHLWEVTSKIFPDTNIQRNTGIARVYIKIDDRKQNK